MLAERVCHWVISCPSLNHDCIRGAWNVRQVPVNEDPISMDSADMGCLSFTRDCYGYRKNSLSSQTMHSSEDTHNNTKNKHTM